MFSIQQKRKFNGEIARKVSIVLNHIVGILRTDDLLSSKRQFNIYSLVIKYEVCLWWSLQYDSNRNQGIFLSLCSEKFS